MLIYAVSLELQLSLCVNIFNQYSNVKLVSPVYFGNGAVCPKLSNQQLEIGAIMNDSFEITITQDELDVALLFKLQKCSNWHNTDTSTTETNKNKATHAYMLITWKVRDSKPFVCVVLVENDKAFTWNEDKLKELYEKNSSWFNRYNDIVSNTWLVVLRGNSELSVYISKGEYAHAIKPSWIDVER
jgi:hypothetical protein